MSRRPYGYERGGRSYGQRDRPQPYERESGHGDDRMNGTSRQEGDNNYEYHNRNRSPNMRVHNDRSRWSPLPKDYNRTRQGSANEHGVRGRLDHREHGRNRSPQNNEFWLRRRDYSGRTRASPSREINPDMNQPGRNRSLPSREFNQGMNYPGRTQSSPNRKFNQGINYSGWSRPSPNEEFNQGMDYSGRIMSPPNGEFNQDMDYPGRSRSPPNEEFNQGMDYPGRSRSSPNREFNQGMNYLGRSRSPPNREFNQGMNYSPNRGFNEGMNYPGGSWSPPKREFNEGMNYPGGRSSPPNREYDQGMDFRLQTWESPKNLGCNSNGRQSNQNIAPSRMSPRGGMGKKRKAFNSPTKKKNLNNPKTKKKGIYPDAAEQNTVTKFDSKRNRSSNPPVKNTGNAKLNKNNPGSAHTNKNSNPNADEKKTKNELFNPPGNANRSKNNAGNADIKTDASVSQNDKLVETTLEAPTGNYDSSENAVKQDAADNELFRPRAAEVARNNTRIFQIPSLDEDTKITLVLLNHILYTVFAKAKAQLEHANVLTDNFLEHRNAVKLMKYEVRKLVDELPVKKSPQQKREWTHADAKRIKMAKLQTSKTLAIEALTKLFEQSSLESGKTEKLVEECLDVLLEENYPEDLKPELEDYAKDSGETLCEATLKEDFQWQYVVAAYQMIGFKLVDETPPADERGKLTKLHLEDGTLAAVLVESIRLFQGKGKKVKPGDNVVLTGQVAKLVKHAQQLTYLRNSECIQIYNTLLSKGIKYETKIMSVLPRDADLDTTSVLHFTNMVLYFDQAMTVLQYRMVQMTPHIPLSDRVKTELFDLIVHTVYRGALKILRNGETLGSRKMD